MDTGMDLTKQTKAEDLVPHKIVFARHQLNLAWMQKLVSWRAKLAAPVHQANWAQRRWKERRSCCRKVPFRGKASRELTRFACSQGGDSPQNERGHAAIRWICWLNLSDKALGLIDERLKK